MSNSVIVNTVFKEEEIYTQCSTKTKETLSDTNNKVDIINNYIKVVHVNNKRRSIVLMIQIIRILTTLEAHIQNFYS